MTKNIQTRFFTKSFDQKDITEVPVKKTRGRPKPVALLEAYKATLPISVPKFENLQTMCKDITITKSYHDFYNSLKTDRHVRDALAEPDFKELEPENHSAE